jgi:hypothetical protein
MLTTRFFLFAALVAATPALAQDATVTVASTDTSSKPAAATAAVTDTQPEKKSAPKAVRYYTPAIEIQHLRPLDQRGLNVFESPKEAGAKYEGFKLSWGGAFAQQFQNLTHQNKATPKVVNGVNQNSLIAIGSGFNNADANLYLNVQLARGIRVAVETYASARHHNESWVKDGYFLIDGSPLETKLLDSIMEGRHAQGRPLRGQLRRPALPPQRQRHDALQPVRRQLRDRRLHDRDRRRAYLRKNGYLAMLGMTGGEVKGQVTAPGPAWPQLPRQARRRQAAAPTSASASPARCTRRIAPRAAR